MSLVENMIKRLAEAKSRATAASSADQTVRASDAGMPAASSGAQSAINMPAVQRPSRNLDFAALRASGLLAAEHERRLFSQVYRGIKRPILNRLEQRSANAPDRIRDNILMVASAVPGDGKTFTAVNLALSLAQERDRQVVLVDGDVVKRELSRRFGFLEEPGLMELLADSTLVADNYVIQTDLPNLAVLPAGQTSLHATEMLASARMRAVVEQIAVGPDVLVIFDSPPLLLTTEARVIAEISGQALLVVREGQTSKDMLDRALPMLQICPSVSLILNQSMSPPNSGYGYGYGYGYGHEEKTQASDEQ